MNSNRKLIISLASIFIIFTGLSLLSNIYVDYLWYEAEGYSHVFRTILFSTWGLWLFAMFFSFIFIYANLLMTRKSIGNSQLLWQDDNVIHLYNRDWANLISPKTINISFVIVSFITAFFISGVTSGHWDIPLKFINSTAFNLGDPIFNKDISFYFFSLPFYWFLYRLVISTLLATGFLLVIIYFIANPKEFLNKFRLDRSKIHLLGLLAFFLLLKAVGYLLNQYELLFSNQGAAFGAGYTDVHAKLLALKILPIIALISSGAVILAAIKKRVRLVFLSLGLLFVSSVVLTGIIPSLVQKFSVEPDELNKETPYLGYNIEYTRKAYGLDKIKKQPYQLEQEITVKDLESNSETVKNIRLWDWQPLKQTFGQLQEMRSYYQFNDVDIDRYIIDGEYRQVMLSARELTSQQLPARAKTWINEKLTYTHGYGIAMTPVNEVTNEGLPKFFIQNIPPQSTIDIKVARPEIYFGEITDGYVIVNTKANEFDYPKGDENVYSNYKGSGGVKLDSYWKRLVFAWKYKELKLLLNNDISSDSKILLNRNIVDRVRKVTPFLTFDKDPYLALVNGKLLWIIDGYTLSGNYPYSEPYKDTLNYIRNSVKVIVDAYSGKMDFYITEANDPLIQTYSKVFPGLFKNWEAMPTEIKVHVRYPEDLFAIQSEIYSNYHMEDPQIFYNREDRWSIPEEIFASEKQTMEAYYTIMKLPGEDKPEFILMRPYTAATKPNMVSWMAARSDGEHYGTLLVYQFPKQKLIYGPMQVESRINQDSEISQQLTLWDQRGSQVIRGNLLVIPIEDSILYVEPLYLQAEQSKMPELRRVIVAYGETIVMEKNLPTALEKIFGKPTTSEVLKPETTGHQEKDSEAANNKNITNLITKANRLFEESQQKIEAGDWSGYGETLKQLEETLKQLQDIKG